MKLPKARSVFLVFFVTAAVGTLSMVVVQVAFPKNRLPLHTKIGAVSFNFLPIKEVSSKWEQFLQPLVLQNGDKIITITPAQVGLTVDTNKTLAQIPSVSLKQRLIPFWGWHLLARQYSVEPVLVVNQSLVNQVSETISKDNYRAPVDATIQVANDTLEVNPEQPGVQVNQITLHNLIISTFSHLISAHLHLPLPTETITPTTVAADFSSSQSQFDQLTESPLTVKIDDKVFTLSSADLAQLLEVEQSAGKTEIQLNNTTLSKLVGQWSATVNKAPGVTQITYLDGLQTSQQIGESGQKLNTQSVTEAFTKWLATPQNKTVQISTTEVPPTVVKNNTYSNSNQALEQQLRTWMSQHSGNYEVAMRELGGGDRSVSINGDAKEVTASTYKLFVAYAAFKESENNQLSLSAGAYQNENVAQCIEPMIVISDNNCGEALGWLIGWDKIDSMAHDAGFNSVALNNYDSHKNVLGDKLVSANDLAQFSEELASGSLLSTQDTNTLLGYMKRQIYRQGIPAGSEGATVADKVGFLDNTLNDAGVVYGSKSTYALSIMTTNASWGQIEDLAEVVYKFMNE